MGRAGRDRDKSTRLASLPGVKLEAAKSYTFLLTGRPGKHELVKIEDQVRRGAELSLAS